MSNGKLWKTESRLKQSILNDSCWYNPKIHGVEGCMYVRQESDGE